MFTRKHIDENEATEFFLSDPNLCWIGLPDNDLQSLYHNKKYIQQYNTVLVGIYDETGLMCVIRWEPFSQVIVSMHVYLATRYHHTGTLRKILHYIKPYFEDPKFPFLKAIIMHPSNVPHVGVALKATGFTYEGTLKDGIVWRQELVDLNFYSIELDKTYDDVKELICQQ